MFMDNLMMYRSTLEFWNKLENINLLLWNMYKKVRKKWEGLVSLAIREGQCPTGQTSENVLWPAG